MGRFKLYRFYVFRLSLCFRCWHTICGIYNSWSILCKKDQCGGGGIRTHEPLRDGITHLSFFSLYMCCEKKWCHGHPILSPARLTRLRYPSAHSSCL